MKKKYFINKSKDLKFLGQFGLYGFIGAASLFVINIISVYLFSFTINFYILGLPVVLFLLYLPRVLILMFFPVIIITDTFSKYFNIIGYNKLKWIDFDFAAYDENSLMISCMISNGRILNRLDLANLNLEDRNEIIEVFKTKTSLKTTNKTRE